MACPVLISPACVVAGKVVGAVAGTAASGALNGIAAAIVGAHVIPQVERLALT